ncbi:MAG: twin-arginine translocation pathway signal protein [Polaromonas sp.]|nr:twin-arginine translocation pathway signal protein [Polaromonas sp.]
MSNRRTILQAGALLGASVIVRTPLAQTGGRPVRIIVGFLPGGLTDVLARQLAEGLNKLNLGSTFIVENHAGANGRISITRIKSSPPDGMHLLLTGSAVVTLLPHFFKKDDSQVSDLVPINAAYSFAYGFSVGPAVPASVKTLSDYLAWAKANPAKATYACVAANPQHLLAAQLSRISNTPLTMVPYKGGGPLMIQDVLRGDVGAVSGVTGDVLQWQGPDKLRTLATYTRKRTSSLPDVPTAIESGFTDVVVDDYGAVFAPKGTPQAIVTRYAEAIRQVVMQPPFKAAMTSYAVEPLLTDGQQLASNLKNEFEFWGKVVAATGITME